MTTPSQEQIARIANAIWQSEGRPTGRDYEHWMRARKLIEEGRAEIEYPEAAGAGDAEDGSTRSVKSDSEDPSTGMFPYTKNRLEPRKEPSDREANKLAEAQDEGDARAEPRENPGPRNPPPLPPTNAEGYAVIPSTDDAAAGAVSGDPQTPQAVGEARSARRSGATPKPPPSGAQSEGRNR